MSVNGSYLVLMRLYGMEWVLIGLYAVLWVLMCPFWSLCVFMDLINPAASLCVLIGPIESL